MWVKVNSLFFMFPVVKGLFHRGTPPHSVSSHSFLLTDSQKIHFNEEENPQRLG